MNNFLETLLAGAIQILPKILLALLIVVVSLYLARWISKLLNRVLKKRKADPEVSHLLVRMSRWSIIAVGLIMALQRFFDVTAFLTGLGILGFTVGFAMQNILQNFVAGVILLLQQPFNVGDAIEVSDYGGSVLAINLRTTELRTWDGRIVIIPNSDVLSNTITNFTRAIQRRIDISIGISYASDPEAARKIILEELESVPGYLTDPEASVVFDTFGDSAIKLTVYFWIDTGKVGYFAAKYVASSKIKTALDRKGIEMPFPSHTLYLHQTKA